MAIIEIDQQIIKPHFLSFQLRLLRSFIENLAHGASQKGLYLSQLSKVKVLVPDIQQQNLFIKNLAQIDKSKFICLYLS